MTDHAHELRRYSRKIGYPAGDIPYVMLSAAKEIERLREWEKEFGHLGTPDEVGNEWHSLSERIEAAEKERDALRAELAQLHKEADKFGDGIDWIQRALQAEAQIEAMEPVARLLTWVGRDPYNKNRVIARTYDELNKNAYPEWEEGSPLYLTHVAQPQLNEIKTALKRALELGQRETWTGARKHRSREDQREERQCWNKVWRLLDAQGEEK